MKGRGGGREKEKEKEPPRPKTPPPVDERVAHVAMRHFIVGNLNAAGFEGAENSAVLDEIERQAVLCECYSRVKSSCASIRY